MLRGVLYLRYLGMYVREGVEMPYEAYPWTQLQFVMAVRDQAGLSLTRHRIHALVTHIHTIHGTSK